MRLFHPFRHIFWVATGAIALTAVGSHALIVKAIPSAAQPSQAKAPVMVADSKAIQSLTAHLKKVGAKMYGAYWCPHCKEQKDLFGESVRNVNYIECDPKGENAKPDQCRAAKITAYPSWEIKGKMLVGVQSLEELATASGYKGPNNF